MDQLVIGIIGSELERHCQYLAREIDKQGAVPLILDNSPELPFPLTLGDEQSLYMRHDLNETDVYFLRALFLPTPAFPMEPIAIQLQEEGYPAYARERERYAAWLSWLKCAPLAGKQIVNPAETMLLHFAKPYQLELLRQSGVPVPPTLVTSQPELLLEFSERREVVYKPVAGGALCRILTDEDKKPERLEALASAPVLFQEYIPGKDLRVFVLDGRVIASFLVEGEGVDYRAGGTKLTPYTVSAEIAKLCARACLAQGLIFSGIDLKLCPDGSVVMLECNPSPMFEGFDLAADVSVVSQLASYLIETAYRLRRSKLDPVYSL